MERVVERDNVILALKRVQKNKGSPGIDGMTVATNTGRWWRHSALALNRALPVRHFDDLGLPRLDA